MFAAAVIAAVLACGQATPPTTVSATTAAALEKERLEREEFDRAEVRRLQKLKAELEAASGEGELEGGIRRTPAPDAPSLAIQLVKMIFTLGAVCLLAYLLLGKLLPKLLRIEPPVAQRRIMQVIDRLPIDQRRSIIVMRIGDQYFLVGASEGGIHLISKLDSDEIDHTLATQQVEKPTLGRLASLLARKRE